MIDESIKKEKQKKENENFIQLVCLGPSDSGKSTVIKQLQLLVGGGFSAATRAAWKPVILHNLLRLARELARVVQDSDDAGVKNAATYLQQLPIGMEPKSPLEMPSPQIVDLQKSASMSPIIDKQVLSAIETVWDAIQLRRQFKEILAYVTLSSALYFFEHLARVCAPEFLPNDEDILRARVKTQQITSFNYVLGDTPLRIYDVAGHKSQRHKWISFFDDAEAILFVASVSAYDQVLEEDPQVNRLVDTLELFDAVVNNKLLKYTDIILFLNKIDLLPLKLDISPFKNFIPAYDGVNEAKSVLKFVKIMFKLVNKTSAEQRNIYVHNTHATDKKSMTVIVVAMTEIVMKLNIRNSGVF